MNTDHKWWLITYGWEMNVISTDHHYVTDVWEGTLTEWAEHHVVNFDANKQDSTWYWLIGAWPITEAEYKSIDTPHLSSL